jgi:hemolysin-activating ACP:hemolysin acyltransferase
LEAVFAGETEVGRIDDLAGGVEAGDAMGAVGDRNDRKRGPFRIAVIFEQGRGQDGERVPARSISAMPLAHNGFCSASALTWPRRKSHQSALHDSGDETVARKSGGSADGNGGAAPTSNGGGEGAGQAEGAAAAGGGAPPAAEGGAPAQQLDPELLKKVAQLRLHVRESFGKVVMAMMMLPRYRHQSIADLQHLVLEPLIRDRIAVAHAAESDPELSDIAGVAIWASVSEEVDARIREQVRAGVFPVRLKPDDWTSGSVNWLLDVIAPDAKGTASVIANFRQVVKEGSLRLHPIVSRLVDPETLRKMGAEKITAPAG